MVRFVEVIIETLYKKILGKEISERSAQFLSGSNTVFIGLILAKIMGTILVLHVTNIEGKDALGAYSLMLAASMLLIIPYLLGIDTAMVHYGSLEEDKRGKIIATTYVMVTALILIFTAVFLRFSAQIADLVDYERWIFEWAVVLSVLAALSTLFEKTIQIFALAKPLSIIKILDTAAALATFIPLNMIWDSTFSAFFVAICVGHTVAGLYGFTFGVRERGWKIDPKWSSTLIQYGKFSALSGLFAWVLFFSDRMIINHFLGIGQVGVYYIYYMAAVGIVSGFAIQAAITMMFPMVSQMDGREMMDVYRKMNHVLPIFLIITYPIIILSEFLILRFVKDEISMQWELMLLFALMGCVYATNRLYSWFLSAEGKTGIRTVSMITGIIAVMNFVLNWFMVQKWGIEGVVVATTLVFALSVTMFYTVIPKVLEQDSGPGDGPHHPGSGRRKIPGSVGGRDRYMTGYRQGSGYRMRSERGGFGRNGAYGRPGGPSPDRGRGRAFS